MIKKFLLITKKFRSYTNFYESADDMIKKFLLITLFVLLPLSLPAAANPNLKEEAAFLNQARFLKPEGLKGPGMLFKPPAGIELLKRAKDNQKGFFAAFFSTAAGLNPKPVSGLQFVSFSELGGLALWNKKTIQNMKSSSSCKGLQQRAGIIKLTSQAGLYVYLLPLDVQFAAREGGFDKYSLKAIPALHQFKGLSSVRGRWMMPYSQSPQILPVFVSQAESDKIKMIYKNRSHEFDLKKVKLFESLPTEGGDTAEGCEFKKVVSKISFGS